MRLALAGLLLLVAVSASAAERRAPVPPPSAALLLRLHPAAWRPPALATRTVADIRFEPETGEPALDVPTRTAAERASARARAEAAVRRLPDGSGHAVVGGLFRTYTVAHVDAEGRLVQDCVHSEAEAIRRVQATATPKSGGH